MKTHIKKYRFLAHSLRHKIVKNRNLILFILLFLFIIPPQIYRKFSEGPRYVNKAMGYAITGPSRWHMEFSQDRRTVSFKKYKEESFDNAIIKLVLEFGNPYGSSALDYIENGLIPQIKYSYEQGDRAVVHFRTEPHTTIRNGIEWATVSFLLNYDELQTLYVTTADDYVFILAFISKGPYQGRHEELFYQTLDSFVMDKVRIKRKSMLFQKETTSSLSE